MAFIICHALASNPRGIWVSSVTQKPSQHRESARANLGIEQSTTMALLVHELTTNSAKYGALSSATGQVAVRWSLSGTRLNLEWRERDGPVVATPVHRGFGTRLLSGALEQFGGTVETTFEPTGLICTLSATLPEKNAATIGSDVTSTNNSTEFTSLSDQIQKAAPFDQTQTKRRRTS
jgi:hypothetical protein